MKLSFRDLLLGVGASLLLAGCGGGGSDDDGRNTATKPTSVILASSGGSAITSGAAVKVGTVISLDGSNSVANGGSLAYQWTLSNRPEGSSATIATANGATTNLVPDLPGDYVVQLTVDNGSNSNASTLALIATNENPIARVAQQDIEALLGSVQLDGSSSIPPAGGVQSSLTYQWSLKDVPSGSALRTFSEQEATQARPRFTPDEVGVYLVELRVAYNGKTSDPITVKITVVKPHTKPVAVIKSVPETAVRGNAITLDGTDSVLGSGGSTMQYRWTIIGGPTLVPPTKTGMNSAIASFTPQAAGTYQASLTVFDGVSTATTSSAYISVTKPADAPNTPPVVVLTPYGNATLEAEKGTRIQFGQTSSYDIDDASFRFNPIFGAEYEFTKYPAGFDPSQYLQGGGKYIGDAGFTSIKSDSQYDEYTIRVRMHDDHYAWSEWSYITFRTINGANIRPTAGTATLNGSLSVKVGEVVRLTGASSADANKNELTYAWTLADHPDGSNATLTGANTVTPTFTADKAGPYTAHLVVTDSHGDSSMGNAAITILAKTENHLPVARPSLVNAVADKDQPLVITEVAAGTPFNIVGGNVQGHWRNAFHLYADSYDPDGEEVTHLWSLTREPSTTTPGYPVTLSEFVSITQGWKTVDTTTQANTFGLSFHPLHNRVWTGFYSNIYPCPIGGTHSVTQETTESYVNRQFSSRQWDCSIMSLAPMQAGEYDLELLISDGLEFSGPYKFNLSAVKRANYPTLLLEDTQSGDSQYRVFGANYNGPLVGMVSRMPPTGVNVQRFFPFSLRAEHYSDASYSPPMEGIVAINSNLLPEAGGDNVFQTYQLTAFDRDYTITDLNAAWSDQAFQARIEGLTNNQVIKKGQTVSFKLIFTSPARNTLTSGTALHDAGEGIEWSFRIAEREGWTFSAKPRFEMDAQ